MNRTIRLESIPSRIVSLVPSQTELLYDLGLDKEVVGITKFCIYPDLWYRSKLRVGGTKQLNIDAIKRLKPDLIIGNKEENTKSDIEALEQIAPVWMSDISTIAEALDMVKSIGNLLNREQEAIELVESIQERFENVKKAQGLTFLYFIWKDPDYLAGKETFINSMLEDVGLENLCQESRYPEYSSDIGVPDLVLLSSEPYPFKGEQISEFQKKFPKAKVRIIDGEMCSWYGSRMLLAPHYFAEFLKD